MENSLTRMALSGSSVINRKMEEIKNGSPLPTCSMEAAKTCMGSCNFVFRLIYEKKIHVRK